MISKFLSKLKSILFKSAVTSETPLKKEKKAAKSAKTKTKTKTKTKITTTTTATTTTTIHTHAHRGKPEHTYKKRSEKALSIFTQIET